MLFLGSDDRGHTLVYDSSEDGVGRGIGPNAFPAHFPRCLLRDGRGRPAQQEETEARLPRGPPEGGATPIWISAPLQGDRGEVHPLGGEPEEGGRRWSSRAEHGEVLQCRRNA